MKKVLLLCSSTDGQTRKICDRLHRILQDAGDMVTLAMIEDALELSPAGFEMAVIGARIRYGRTDARVIQSPCGAAQRDAQRLFLGQCRGPQTREEPPRNQPLLSGGPTDRDAVVEFTDWQRVEAFGQTLRAALRP
jgi:menaquinone-dependent protoporphyrinogen IX oxidase